MSKPKITIIIIRTATKHLLEKAAKLKHIAAAFLVN
jgi:hypothetical protein